MPHLGWRSACVCAEAGDEHRGRRTAAALEGQKEAARALLTSPDFRECPPDKLPDGPSDEGHDGRSYLRWLFNRVRAVNAAGFPRVRVVWWGTLEGGEIPCFPNDSGLILDLELLLEKWLQLCDEDEEGRVEGRYVAVVMDSHTWERPHWCEQCAGGSACAKQAHPDTEGHKKANMWGAAGRAEYERAPFGVDTYRWVDFAGIDQSDSVERLHGAVALPCYMSVTEMLNITLSEGYSGRAWTALERLAAYHCMPLD